MALIAVAFLFTLCSAFVNCQVSRITVTPAKLSLTAHDVRFGGGTVNVTCQPPVSGVFALLTLSIQKAQDKGPESSPVTLATADATQRGGRAVLVESPLTFRAEAFGGISENSISLYIERGGCRDSGTYICVVEYRGGGGEFPTAVDSANLTVEVTTPGNITMTQEGRPSAGSHWVVNDTLVLKCTAPVGSVTGNSTQISWVWTYLEETSASWRLYDGRPADVQAGGLVPAGSCYSNGSSTLTRRLTLEDSRRQYRCYVRRDGVDYSQAAEEYSVGDVIMRYSNCLKAQLHQALDNDPTHFSVSCDYLSNEDGCHPAEMFSQEISHLDSRQRQHQVALFDSYNSNQTAMLNPDYRNRGVKTRWNRFQSHSLSVDFNSGTCSDTGTYLCKMVLLSHETHEPVVLTATANLSSCAPGAIVSTRPSCYSAYPQSNQYCRNISCKVDPDLVSTLLSLEISASYDGERRVLAVLDAYFNNGQPELIAEGSLFSVDGYIDPANATASFLSFTSKSRTQGDELPVSCRAVFVDVVTGDVMQTFADYPFRLF